MLTGILLIEFEGDNKINWNEIMWLSKNPWIQIIMWIPNNHQQQPKQRSWMDGWMDGLSDWRKELETQREVAFFTMTEII